MRQGKIFDCAVANPKEQQRRKAKTRIVKRQANHQQRDEEHHHRRQDVRLPCRRTREEICVCPWSVAPHISELAAISLQLLKAVTR